MDIKIQLSLSFFSFYLLNRFLFIQQILGWIKNISDKFLTGFNVKFLKQIYIIYIDI